MIVNNCFFLAFYIVILFLFELIRILASDCTLFQLHVRISQNVMI